MVDLEDGAGWCEGADPKTAAGIGLSDHELIRIQSMDHNPAVRRHTSLATGDRSHAAFVGGQNSQGLGLNRFRTLQAGWLGPKDWQGAAGQEKGRSA